MRTFKLEFASDMEVVVPDSWVKLMREQATAPDTTPFLKNAQEMFP